MSKPSHHSCRFSNNDLDCDDDQRRLSALVIRIMITMDDHDGLCDDDAHEDNHLVSIEEHAATKESREASSKEETDQDDDQFHFHDHSDDNH